MSSVSHRGPDASGIAVEEGKDWSWALGHTRLSIVDLSESGEQPISNEDGSLSMIYNGEIYNYADLRRECESSGNHRFKSNMDGEVIVHLWETEGAACLDRLNGIFAVAIADKRTGTLTLGRDPVGVKPLFYSSKKGHLWFASELQALAAAGAPLEPHDVTALAQFLTFLWVPHPRTPYRSVSSLPPGHVLEWERGTVSVRRACRSLVPRAPRRITRDRSLEEARNHVSAATQRQLMADVPVGLMASGGIDSGLIWWGTRNDIERCFTISWPSDSGSERLHEDETAVRELESRFRTPVDYLDGRKIVHTLVPSSGDLLADPAYDLTRLIARAASGRSLKVLLSGQGGDELFAGYRRHAIARLLPKMRFGAGGRVAETLLLASGGPRVQTEYLARIARATSERSPFRAYMQLCSYSTASDRARALGCDESEVTDDIVWQNHLDVFDGLPEHASFLRKVMALDLALYLPGLGLCYVDRAGMEYGVEIRVPWLDLELVRWSLGLPEEVLVRLGRGKWLTRELAAQCLSHDLAHRPKRAFAAPVSRIREEHRWPTRGERGFRQGAYFAKAAQVLGAFLDSAPSTRKLAEGSLPNLVP